MRIYSTLYRSFNGGFSIKVSTSDVNRSANDKTFDTITFSNDNLTLKNNVYLSIESNDDYSISVAFVPTNLYQLKELFNQSLFDESDNIITDTSGNPLQYSVVSLGQKTITISPAVVAVENSYENRVAMSINGNEWMYMTTQEYKGISDMFKNIDLVFYQLHLGSTIALYKEATNKSAPMVVQSSQRLSNMKQPNAQQQNVQKQATPARSNEGVFANPQTTVTQVEAPPISVVSNKKVYNPMSTTASPQTNNQGGNTGSPVSYKMTPGTAVVSPQQQHGSTVAQPTTVRTGNPPIAQHYTPTNVSTGNPPITQNQYTPTNVKTVQPGRPTVQQLTDDEIESIF